jgi:hypothetical protein
VVDEEEGVSPEAARGWLDDRQYGSGRDRGIHGVATPPQHLGCRLGSERMGADDHATAGDCRGTSKHAGMKPDSGAQR